MDPPGRHLCFGEHNNRIWAVPDRHRLDPPGRHLCVGEHNYRTWADLDRHTKPYCFAENPEIRINPQTQKTWASTFNRFGVLQTDRQNKVSGQIIRKLEISQ